MTYKDISGNIHYMDEAFANDVKTASMLDKEYIAAAQNLAESDGCPVFYSVYPIKGEFFKAYFLIPITAEDVDCINEKFGKDFIIGIYYPKYNHSQP